MQTLALVGGQPPKAATPGCFRHFLARHSREVRMYEFDPRWPDDPRDDDRDRDLSRGSRGSSDDRDSVRDLDLRDVFISQVDLPRGRERERVFEHDHAYRLRGSEGRTMTTVGAFRVVPAGDLRDGQNRPLEPNR